MIRFFYTIPFWHRYTGPFRKDLNFSKPGRTWLDSISKSHDWAYSKNHCPHTFVGLPFATKESLHNGIQADTNFIIEYLAGLFTFEFFDVNYDKSIFNNFLLKALESMFQSTVDIFIGAIGVGIFILNILLANLFLLFK